MQSTARGQAQPRAIERQMQIPKFGIVLVLVVVFGILEDDSSNSEFTPNAVTPPARSEACTREKRNKRQGLASGGKDAVYIGFDLEQAQRYAG